MGSTEPKNGADRPLGPRTDLGRPFWEAARDHRLVVQRCGGCGMLRHYPQVLCPGCLSDQVTWAELSGRGIVYTFTVTHQGFHPWWAARTPYAVVTVELAEGVRMVSDLPAEDLEHVAIGLPVEVFFDRVDDEVTLPRFRLVR